MKESEEDVILKTAEARIWAGISELNELTIKQCTKIGNRALEFIGDAPLYASTSGISYVEAIAIALVMSVPVSDLKKLKKEKRQ